MCIFVKPKIFFRLKKKDESVGISVMSQHRWCRRSEVASEQVGTSGYFCPA